MAAPPRAPLLPLLPLLLLVLTLTSQLFPSAAQPVAPFTALPTPPWSPRILQGWAFITRSVAYQLTNGTSGVAPPGSLVTWGGGDAVSYNDIYLSLDRGQTFNLIGGVGVTGPNSTALTYTPSPHNANNFVQDDSGACKAYDPYQSLFYVFDETNAWISSDGLNWRAANSTPTAEYVYRTSTECLVLQNSAVAILGGQSSGSAYENDVWLTSTNASSFTQQTGAAPWTQRDSTRGVAMTTASGTEVIYLMGGHAKVINDRSSEVWVSSDLGATWVLLGQAPWLGRDHFQAVLTPNNIIVMLGGKADYLTVGGNHLGLNDVWASMDGGFSWGFCGFAPWPVRQDHTAAIDPQGYIYISGGTSYNVSSPKGYYGTLQDAWKSTLSFSNVTAVSAACTISGQPLPVPATLGLVTFPVVLNSNPFTAAYAGLTATATTTATPITTSNATTVLPFCYTASSYPNSPYGPWSIVISGTLTVLATPSVPSLSLAPVTAGGGRPGYTVVSAAATRTQVNRDGSVSSASLGLCAAGVQGSDQLVYGSAPYTDWNGFCLSVLNSTDSPAGTTGWLVYPNDFPSRQIEVYYDLPSQNYPNLYHADQPFNPQLTISFTSAAPTCTAPSTAPQAAPVTSSYQFCYQAYGTYGGLPWQSSVGGTMTTLSSVGLTASSSLGLTAATYGQYVLSVSGSRLQAVGSNASTTNPIVGLSWINPGGLDGNDGMPDPFLLPTQPHLSGSCPNPSAATCFGGLVLYAANAFAFPNGARMVDSAYALVNAVDLRVVNGSVYEVSGPVPTFSQFAVAALASGAQAAACPLISAASAASSIDSSSAASPLFSTSAAASATSLNISFSYYLNSLGVNSSTSVAYSANGFWSVQVSGQLTVTPLAASSAAYTGAASASQYPTAYTVVGASGQRIYTDATGRTTVSRITGVLPASYVYTAGSSVNSPLSNDNVIYASATTSTGYGYGTWTVDAGGLALLVTPPASAPLGNAGLPGFPTTARFNSFIYLQLRSSATNTSGAAGLYEVGWGPLVIGNGISAPDSFTAEAGLAYAAYSTSLGVQMYSALNPLPVSLTPASTAYTTAGMCYIIYPDETAQNGNWSIAVSALLYLSPQLITVPFGTVLRQAQLIYSLSQLTRVYIDQYGQAHTSTGAVLQGPGGDGGSDNLIYTSVLAGQSEGYLVDGDGFTYTLTGAGAVTPGDPTLALGINFYSETAYREAAEPWHQDGEYGGAGTSFTLYPGMSTAPACVATPFTPAPASSTSTSLQFAFCYSIQGSAGWSVVTSGVFSTSATSFSSFNSANTLLYYIGTGISGTRTYLASATATPLVSTITGLPGPGGDGLYDQKYYYQQPYLLDNGGWGYSVTPAAQVYGVTSTSSIVRVYNNATSGAGPWLEYGLPQLQGTTAANVAASNFYIQPYTGTNSYTTCSPTSANVSSVATAPATSTATTVLPFCYTASSYPNSPYGPWSIVISGTLTVLATPSVPSLSLAPVTAGGGRPGYTVVSAAATRTQVNRDGSVSSASLGLCAAGVQGSDQLVYGSAPYTDWNGFCLSVLNSTDSPAGTTGWLVYPNDFPSRQIEVYYDLPSQNYPNLYHADQPFNPQLTISFTSAAPTCTAPSTAPQAAPVTSSYQFCYQAYGTYGGLPWQSSVGGTMTTLSSVGLTASSSLGLTAATYGQYVLSVSGSRLQAVGSNASTTNPIVGLSWINPGGLDGNDGMPDPFLLPTQPHLSGSCPNPSAATCFGGLVLYAANAFAFPNGARMVDSAYALVNAVDLRVVNGSVYEVSGPVPTFSQFAVAALASGAQAAACPLISAASAASSIDSSSAASPLFSTSAAASATSLNISFSYYLNSLGVNSSTSVAYSANGFWSVQVSGQLTVTPLAASSAAYTGAASASQYPTAYTVVGASGQRIYTDATGRTTVSRITGVLPASYVYTAGSSVNSPLSNDNVIYASATTSTGYGYGTWTVDAGGLALLVTPPASAPLGNAGLPGFPTTARFNSFIYLQLRSSATNTSGAAGLYEVGWGPLVIGNGISAPDSFTAEAGLAYAAYSTSLGVQMYSALNPLPVSLTPASTAYTTAGMCYIIYPDETAQNGNWSIAVSALLYLSPQLITVPFGTVLRQAQLIYSLSQLTRVYIDQYGQAHTSTGAVLQGPGGDGGSDNLIYTSVLAGQSEGYLVDGDGFTYTLTGAGAVTPGDPTLALGINFYSETAYREAAEPWHQDGEYGGAGTSFTLYPGMSTAPACVATPFTPAPASSTSTSLQFAFCYSIQGSAGWSVVTSGVFSTSATSFSSFNSANTLLYYIGTGISGTRTYLASATATPLVSTITGLPGPGGDGLYDQKYYYQQPYLLDNGGWGYSVTPAAQVYGVTSTSSIVRVYNNATSGAGPWLEYGLPQLQGTTAANVAASNFYVRPYIGGASYSTCTPTSATLSVPSSTAGSVSPSATPTAAATSRFITSAAASTATPAAATSPAAGAPAAPATSAPAPATSAPAPTTPSAPPSSTSAAAPLPSTSSSSSSGLSDGSKAAIALGVLLGVTLLLLCCLLIAMFAGVGRNGKSAGPPPASEGSKVGVNGGRTDMATSEVSVGSRAPPERQEIELA